MKTHFWRFASTLEEEFGTTYDRDNEVVICPECQGKITNEEWEFEDYTSGTEDGYVIYYCPLCKCSLTCKPIEL